MERESAHREKRRERNEATTEGSVISISSITFIHYVQKILASLLLFIIHNYFFFFFFL